MQYKFLNIFLDPKELLAQAKNRANININKFLLENNAAQIERIYEFYKSGINLLYINGFIGTGKSEIIDYSTAFLSDETIILKHKCFSSTLLDDILLSFFMDFKRLCAQNIISEPKVKSENFTQKINTYFSQIEKPFVIILDSFEAVLDENRKEILDFIFHLNSMPKIKIIIIGRTFEGKYFKEKNVERITTFALEKSICEKYLKSEKIKYIAPIFDEYFKHSRGYYFYNKFSVKIMKKEQFDLLELLVKFKESYLLYADFLSKHALTYVRQPDKTLYEFLALIRHSVSIDLLKKLNLYNEESINLMIENMILVQDKTQIYVPDFIRERIENTITTNVENKIRQYIIDLYLSQLPLKPMERDICISRQTMRKEIEYHKFFLPKKPKITENLAEINFVSYPQVIDYGEIQKKDQSIKKEPEVKNKAPEPQKEEIQKKDISINLDNLAYQNKSELNKVTRPQEPIHKKVYAPNEEEFSPELDNLSIKELVEMAKQAEEKYNFAKVINLFQKALTLRYDAGYNFYLPMIYTKLAQAYEKVANYEKSLKYYELAQQIHEKAQDFIKVCYIKFSIAKILYETYRTDQAKELFTELVQTKSCPAVLMVKSYLQLANIEEGLANQKNTYEYYQNAISHASQSMDVETLSELYFKYALAMDDKNDIKTAIEYYKKCIELSDNTQINKFLSPTYSNIATLYFEKNDLENATENYLKAYEIDKQNSNLEGMYDSSSKLASIMQKTKSDRVLEFLDTALDCAKLIKDVFYIVSASLAIGDYHYNKRQDEIALKYYIRALDLAKDSFSQENINKINIRINDLKFRLGNENFEQIVELIQEQEHE